MNPNFPDDFDPENFEKYLSEASSKKSDDQDMDHVNNKILDLPLQKEGFVTQNSSMSYQESLDNFISQMKLQDQPGFSDNSVLNESVFNESTYMFSPFVRTSNSSFSSLEEGNFYLDEIEFFTADDMDDSLTVLEGEMNSVFESCPPSCTHTLHRPQKNEVQIDLNCDKKPTPLPSMYRFRFFNFLTIDYFVRGGQQPSGKYNYESSKGLRSPYYSPRVYRYKKSDEGQKQARAKGIVAREGLCPFCVSNNIDLLFHDINSSRYSSHLLTYHGVFTTGTGILDPLNHSFGQEIKKHGKFCEVECVTCPYPDCGVVVKVGKYKEGTAPQQRFSTYIRHVADCHKDHKNSINKRRSSY